MESQTEENIDLDTFSEAFAGLVFRAKEISE